MRDENLPQNGGEETKAGGNRGPVDKENGAKEGTEETEGCPLTPPHVERGKPLSHGGAHACGGRTAEEQKPTAERASVGKIARLPKAIREMLHRRMEDGEPGSVLVAWLNSLPPVQTVLASYFNGVAISEKNLSNWRKTGFERWKERQESLLEVKELAEEAADLNETTTEGLMRVTATLTCRKLLKLMRDEKTTAADVVKIGFAVAALNNVDLSHVKVKHAERALDQKDELVTLAWDKHLRDCAAIAERVKGDEQIEMVHQSEFDNRDKIELIGRRMFGSLWRKRRLPWEDENFNLDEKELERMEAERQAKEAEARPSSEEGQNGTDWTDGTDEPVCDQSSSLANSYAGRFTHELIAEAEAMSTGPNLWKQSSGHHTNAQDDGGRKADAINQGLADSANELALTPALSPRRGGIVDRPLETTTSASVPDGVAETKTAEQEPLRGGHHSDDDDLQEEKPDETAATQRGPTTTSMNPTTDCENGVNETTDGAERTDGGPLTPTLSPDGGEGEKTAAMSTTPVNPAQGEAEPEFLPGDIDRVMRFHGKTLEEAKQILRARRKAWKAWRKKGSMGPNPMHATPEPNYFAPNPGPTPPPYGPCGPPVTTASLRNTW